MPQMQSINRLVNNPKITKQNPKASMINKLNVNFYKLLLISLMFFIPNFSFSGWDDIDWKSCGAGSIKRSFEFTIDKKKFWVSQHTDLEMIMEVNSREYDGYKMDCRLRNHDDKKGYASCITSIDSMMENISRCLLHAKKMCRIHGGYC